MSRQNSDVRWTLLQPLLEEGMCEGVLVDDEVQYVLLVTSLSSGIHRTPDGESHAEYASVASKAATGTERLTATDWRKALMRSISCMVCAVK